MTHNMDDSFHSGMGGFGFGHWGFGLFFWIILFLVIAALIKYLFFSHGKKKGE